MGNLIGREQLDEASARYYASDAFDKELFDKLKDENGMVKLCDLPKGGRKFLRDDPYLWSKALMAKEQKKKETPLLIKKAKKEPSLNRFLKATVHQESVVQKWESEKPLENTCVLLIHHLTREVLGTIEALRRLGCNDIGAQFLGYNPDAAKIFGPELAVIPDNELRAFKLGVKNNGAYQVDREFLKPTDALTSDALDAALANKDYLTCQRSLAMHVALKMIASCEASGKQFLVIEDGGYIAPLLNDSALSQQSLSSFREEHSMAADADTDEKLAGLLDMGGIVSKHVIGTVEHTRNGYDKVQKVSLKHGKLARPMFTIAISYVKTQFEADSVASTCLNSLYNALLSRGRVLHSRNITIIGSRGNIGGRSAKALQHRVDDWKAQLSGVDLRTGYDNSEERPAWEPSPYESVVPGMYESRRFSDLPREVRRKVDVVFGITGGRTQNPDETWNETLVPSDVEFWLSEGTSKFKELWLVSGSTKTKEFEIVKDWVEDLAEKKEHGEYMVESEDLVDPLTMRDYGQCFSFTSKSSGEVKTLISVNDWKPANFMFYGVPTEDIDVILAQLVDVSVALLQKVKENPSLEGKVYAVDYSPIATDNVIRRHGELDKSLQLPSPPDTAAAQAGRTDKWTHGEKFQWGGI
jgi:hypothetical protein